MPSDSGRFTVINPWPRAITIAYYNIIGLIIRGILLTTSLIIFTFVGIDQMDLRIREDFLFISPGDNRACFEIEAVDDTTIEDTEDVNVTVLPMNPNDRVMDEITSVTITDNDGIILLP